MFHENRADTCKFYEHKATGDLYYVRYIARNKDGNIVSYHPHPDPQLAIEGNPPIVYRMDEKEFLKTFSYLGHDMEKNHPLVGKHFVRNGNLYKIIGVG